MIFIMIDTTMLEKVALLFAHFVQLRKKHRDDSEFWTVVADKMKPVSEKAINEAEQDIYSDCFILLDKACKEDKTKILNTNAEALVAKYNKGKKLEPRETINIDVASISWEDLQTVLKCDLFRFIQKEDSVEVTRI